MKKQAKKGKKKVVRKKHFVGSKRLPMDKTEEEDRFLGCIYGMAIGDAVGTTLEFKVPHSFKKIDDMVGGGAHRLKPGDFTDDTSMGLCLAESLIRKNGMDLVDQLKMYARWKNKAYLSSNGKVFDVGNTCRKALNKFASTGRRKKYCGSTDPKTSGNGSLMRLAAVPMFFKNHSFDECILECGVSSKTTHGSDLCVQSCEFYGALIYGALQGKYTKEQLLDSENGFIPTEKEEKDFWRSRKYQKEVNEVIFGSYKRFSPCKGRLPKISEGGFKGYIVNSGFVVKSLEAALWGFYHSKDYKHGLLMVVNNGHDADTVGAIYGMLAGAYYKYSGIPENWRKRIKKKLWLTNYSIMLYEKSKQFLKKDEDDTEEVEGENV